MTKTTTVEETSKIIDQFNIFNGGEQIFIFHYKAKYRPTFDYVKGRDLQSVREKCLTYCNLFKLHFISVRPFFLDLMKHPRDANGFQQGQPVTQEEKEE